MLAELKLAQGPADTLYIASTYRQQMKAATNLPLALALLALAHTPGHTAGVPVHEYMAPLHQSEWLASEVDGRCQLLHQIPGIGDTKLRQGYREPISFELHLTQEISLGTQCLVEVGPPSWRHNIPVQRLGSLKLVPDAKHVMAKGGAAQKIYQALESGMQTSFSCQQQNNPQSTIKVVISPVRYGMALPEFQKCAANLGSKQVASNGAAPAKKSKPVKKKKASKKKKK
jgi:hypothetical protein